MKVGEKKKELSQERKSECVRCKPVKNAQLRRRSIANKGLEITKLGKVSVFPTLYNQPKTL